jgi:hypothetical protein
MRRHADRRQGVVGVLNMLEPKRSEWRDFLTGIAVIGSAVLGDRSLPSYGLAVIRSSGGVRQL